MGLIEISRDRVLHRFSLLLTRQQTSGTKYRRISWLKNIFWDMAPVRLVKPDVMNERIASIFRVGNLRTKRIGNDYRLSWIILP
jgi:hypothetical protein